MAIPKKTKKTLPIIGRFYNIETNDGRTYSNIEYIASTNERRGIRTEFYMERKTVNPDRISQDEVKSWDEVKNDKK